ncbi:MAG: archaeosortase/exosortase family protein, partial [Opitutales bacterium]
MAIPIFIAVDYFRLLHLEWESNEQYAYGYLIPFIWVWFLWRRFQTSPESQPKSTGLGFLLPFALAALIPFNILWLANPDWRLLFWLYGIGALLLILCLCYYSGGWKLSRHMLPALIVILLGIPWPSGFETALISNMMSLVAAIVSAFLPFCGIPAQQVGNLIYLDGGFVGVAEACSGIRSFQLSIVTAYILGELEWMSWLRRIAMLVFGLLLAFLINLTRTFTLVLLFNQGGAELMDEWHDRIGMISMIAVVVIMYLLAEALAKPVYLKTRPAGTALNPVTRRASIALLGILVISPILAEQYYKLNEGGSRPAAALSVTFETLPDRAKRIQIPDATTALLRYSNATAFSAPTRNADQVTFYQFHWEKGRISSFAGVHRPEVCLPSAGIELVKTYPNPRTIQMHGLEISFRAYKFEGMGNTLHVYFMVRDERKGQHLPPALTVKDRIMQAFRGERILSRELPEETTLIGFAGAPWTVATYMIA